MKENIVKLDEILINLTKTENMPVETKEKIANPNNLPFLQAQLRQRVFPMPQIKDRCGFVRFVVMWQEKSPQSRHIFTGF